MNKLLTTTAVIITAAAISVPNNASAFGNTVTAVTTVDTKSVAGSKSRAGAEAGAKSGAASNSGGNKTEDNDDTYGIALGFPPPTNPSGCMGGWGVVWNFFHTTRFSEDCAGSELTRTALESVRVDPNPFTKIMAVSAMCADPNKKINAMAEVMLNDFNAPILGLPQIGGCPSIK
jgi:hypothetical protein